MCHPFSFFSIQFLSLISFTIYLFTVTPSIFVRNNQWIFQLTALHCCSHRPGGKHEGRGKNREREGEKARKKRGQKRAKGSHDLKSVLKKHHIGPSWCPTVSWQHCRAAFHYMQQFSRLSLSPSFPADCCLELDTISPLLTRLFTCTPEENAHLKFWHHAPLSRRQTGETSKVH